jgi:hypothetical protein
MNGLLLLTLDKVRDIYVSHFIIHCGFSLSGHTPNSKHYSGNAVDFHINDNYHISLQAFELTNIFELLQIDKSIGFGIYPDWTFPGFHLDVRDTKARWGRIANNYVSYEEAIAYSRMK